MFFGSASILRKGSYINTTSSNIEVRCNVDKFQNGLQEHDKIKIETKEEELQDKEKELRELHQDLQQQSKEVSEMKKEVQKVISGYFVTLRYLFWSSCLT